MIELYVIPAGIPDDLDRSRPVVVIDVFRASTSITAALHAGAEVVYVAGSRAEADDLKSQIGGRIVMAGERKGFKIPGYDLGNSPREMTPETVGGRPVIFNSTNGTKLLRRLAGFEHVAVGSLVSLSATLAYAAQFETHPIICCAGREGTFSAEDILAAGLLISKLRPSDGDLDDAATFARRLVESSGEKWRDWAKSSFHGRYLASIGLADDLDYCLTVDRFDFVPVLSGDKIVRNS